VLTEWGHGVTVSTDWIFYWRQSLQDGVYNVPGTLIRASGNSNARFVGQRPGIEARWQVDRHIWAQADYGVFYAGDFLKETQPGRNLVGRLRVLAGTRRIARRISHRKEKRHAGTVGRGANSWSLWCEEHPKSGDLVVLGYSFFAYWVFRGKTPEEGWDGMGWMSMQRMRLLWFAGIYVSSFDRLRTRHVSAPICFTTP
jgi:hypothetical protein